MTFTTTNIYLFLNFKIARPLFNSKFVLFKLLGSIIHHLLVFIYKCDIDVNAKLGKNIIFPHFIGIVIGVAQIGDNCMIRQNVTIGRKNVKSKKYPIIKSNVVIGANAIILGEITIGNNVTIGAGTFVDKSLPSNCVVYNKRELIVKKFK